MQISNLLPTPRQITTITKTFEKRKKKLDQKRYVMKSIIFSAFSLKDILRQ